MRRTIRFASPILVAWLWLVFPPTTGATVPVFGESCNGLAATIKQAGGTVYGTGGADVVLAFNVKAVYTYGGNDTICLAGSLGSGSNADTDAGSGNDWINGCSDEVIPTLNPVVCQGDLYGGSGEDRLLGGDNEYGGSGNDTILALVNGFGQGGNDFLIGITPISFCDGGSGTDTVENCPNSANIP
jgi:hypothetical protein